MLFNGISFHQPCGNDLFVPCDSDRILPLISNLFAFENEDWQEPTITHLEQFHNYIHHIWVKTVSSKGESISFDRILCSQPKLTVCSIRHEVWPCDESDDPDAFYWCLIFTCK